MIFIYKLVDQDDNLFYIGQTNNVERRFKEHKRDFLQNKKELYKKMNKAKIKDFRIEIIQIEDNRVRAELRETMLICYYILEGLPILNKTISNKRNYYGKAKKEKKGKTN